MIKIHAICLALNEEVFIEHQLKTLYNFCSGISILTQYDRDWYTKSLEPDKTADKVLNFPDPEGKIHFVTRRWRDEAAARNHEMDALCAQPDEGIQSHGSPENEIRSFHETPDYFLIVDADEFYDLDTIDRIIKFLNDHRPRGLRIQAYNYKGDWNHRIPLKKLTFTQFGFIRSNIRFEQGRRVTWNETRVQKLFRLFRLPDWSGSLFGFMTCPKEVGMFHHGCWLGSKERLKNKRSRSSHRWSDDPEYARHIHELPVEYVPTDQLPRNIRTADWPVGFLEKPIAGARH